MSSCAVRPLRLGLIIVAAAISPALHAATPQYKLVIQSHRFEPNKLIVPAGEKLALIVENHDATPEEFESYDLNREKVVTGNNRITVYLGPLNAGEYRFFGDFHQATAHGQLIAKPRAEANPGEGQ